MVFASFLANSPLATMHQVDDNIFIGGYLAAADIDTIKRAGITSIVKMFEDDWSYYGGRHRHAGVNYAVFPSIDRPNYDIRADALGALQFIKKRLGAGDRILVHCRAGISRSATVVLLYLMALRGYTLDEALELLSAARSCVQPNEGFMAHLRATDERLQTLRKQPAQPQRAQSRRAL